MKFIVQMTRIGYAFAEIEVEAESMLEARDKALDEAGGHTYSEKTSDYEIQSVDTTN